MQHVETFYGNPRKKEMIYVEDVALLLEHIDKHWLAKMKAHESEEKSRIDSRLAYMFANAPETYHAIKQIIYAS